MSPREIRPRVTWVGVNDPDRRVFDALIPLPCGTSYNAYIVRGSEKTALIDTAEPTFERTFLANLESLGATRLDYVISNHAEQDHSGLLGRILDRHPESRVLCSPKGRSMLLDLLDLPTDRVFDVADGSTISLGDRTLAFLHAPWVHWPETMLTLDVEDRVLFPCDLFGSHFASAAFWASREPRVLDEALRYYATILQPFASHVRRHLDRLSAWGVDVIAPSHGPIWDHPQTILEPYRTWTGDSWSNRVILAFVTMHDSTRRLVEAIEEALLRRDVAVEPFNLSHADLGRLAVALVDSPTLILGSPTVLGGAHPVAVQAAATIAALRPRTRFGCIVGSYGWGGKMVDQVSGLLSNLKLEMLDPLLVRGVPREPDLVRVEALAAAIAERHLKMGLGGQGRLPTS
jgi:flavorubredoxin